MSKKLSDQEAVKQKLFEAAELAKSLSCDLAAARRDTEIVRQELNMQRADLFTARQEMREMRERTIKEIAQFIKNEPIHSWQMTDTVTISREVLEQAQEQVCSYCCPSTWKTAEGRPPHSSLCHAMMTALFSPPPPSGLREALEAVYPEIRREHDAGDGHFSTEQVTAIEAVLASPDNGWVKVDEGHPLPDDLTWGDETLEHHAYCKSPKVVAFRRRPSAEQGG